MKIALYFEDLPGGTVRMQRKDLAGHPNEGEASSVVLVAQNAVYDFMRRQNRQRLSDDGDIPLDEADISQSEGTLRFFDVVDREMEW